MMVAVALIGGALGMLRLAAHALSGYASGPHESLLRVGQEVVTFTEGRKEVTTFVDGEWPRFTFPPATTIPSGIRCLVVGEPAADEDDCDERRPVTVRVVEGSRKDDVFYVARNHLRPSGPGWR
jgi:hypothetical protein